ncbi:uncharacterized protein RHOBADRAFT_56631 [Rhodotorula graminis WP1]|uniref:Uncharacterized protein n=1 Tax=Rhodotorula graminis (strain WP1) TaxID=578459 RepID=A0A0P9EIJ3_RHOGW|nr:uncharacterized protein RHOBADRAFT_56631 [Rhodotorula graminis WP1]KPV71440.1 hypothetical protein RHOBADRAFT_56631 [Rhodotorula graminis WP1]
MKRFSFASRRWYSSASKEHIKRFVHDQPRDELSVDKPAKASQVVNSGFSSDAETVVAISWLPTSAAPLPYLPPHAARPWPRKDIFLGLICAMFCSSSAAVQLPSYLVAIGSTSSFASSASSYLTSSSRLRERSPTGE